MSIAKYCSYSNCIRKVPENYCMIALSRTEPDFEMDGSTTAYRSQIRAAYENWKETKSEDFHLLAEMVSQRVLTEYRPFENFPNWDRHDVINALRPLQHKKVEFAYEFERRFRDRSNEAWEAKRTADANLIEQAEEALKEVVLEIYVFYRNNRVA